MALALATAGCTRPEAAPSIPSSPLPLVLATTAPLTLVTRALAGPCARVEPLLPPGGDPHEAQARPADLLRLRRAALLVENGLGLEAELSLEPLLRSGAAPDLRRVDSSRGIATLPSGGRSAPNPHVWLDPLRARQQAITIAAALHAAIPACRDGLPARQARLEAQLRDLDLELRHQLTPVRGRTVLGLHDLGAYFAERYGLRLTSLMPPGGGEHQAPGPGDLQRIGSLARQHQLRGILVEPGASAGLDGILQDLGLRALPFDPIETLDPEAPPGLEPYLRRQRANAAAVLASLAPLPAP